MRTIKTYGETRELTKEQDDAITALLRGNEVAPETLSAKDKNTIELCFHLGSYVEQDHEKAMYWFKLAAEDNWADAERNLAIYYEKGLGVEKDDSQAAYWYERAANYGNANAMSRIAEFYYDGIGVAENKEKGCQLMDKAIELAIETKDGVLLNWLGDRYHYGDGMLEKNLDKAVKYYGMAADLDVPIAKLNLGQMMKNGEMEGSTEKMEALFKDVADNHSSFVQDAVKWYRKRKGSVYNEPFSHSVFECKLSFGFNKPRGIRYGTNHFILVCSNRSFDTVISSFSQAEASITKWYNSGVWLKSLGNDKDRENRLPFINDASAYEGININKMEKTWYQFLQNPYDFQERVGIFWIQVNAKVKIWVEDVKRPITQKERVLVAIPSKNMDEDGYYKLTDDMKEQAISMTRDYYNRYTEEADIMKVEVNLSVDRKEISDVICAEIIS